MSNGEEGGGMLDSLAAAMSAQAVLGAIGGNLAGVAWSALYKVPECESDARPPDQRGSHRTIALPAPKDLLLLGRFDGITGPGVYLAVLAGDAPSPNFSPLWLYRDEDEAKATEVRANLRALREQLWTLMRFSRPWRDAVPRCPACAGTGEGPLEDDDAGPPNCGACDGTGKLDGKPCCVADLSLWSNSICKHVWSAEQLDSSRPLPSLADVLCSSHRALLEGRDCRTCKYSRRERSDQPRCKHPDVRLVTEKVVDDEFDQRVRFVTEGVSELGVQIGVWYDSFPPRAPDDHLLQEYRAHTSPCPGWTAP